MKKLIFSVLVLSAFFSVALCGCNSGDDELKQRLDALEESNRQLEERVEELEKENELLRDMLTEINIIDGEFYTLQQAYDEGWLTQEDLKDIAWYHNGGNTFNEQIMGGDFQPRPKSPEALDKMTDRSIKQTYIKSFLSKENAGTGGVHIDGYYGSYNGCYPLMMSDNYSGTTGAIVMRTVGGVTFYYNSGNEIKIWKAL